MLFITGVQAFGLKSTELLGKSDPFVVFNYESSIIPFTAKTSVLKDSGDNVVWENLKIKNRVKKEDLFSEKAIIVEVWDENSILKNCLLGTGKINLKRSLRKLGTEIQYSVNLVNAHGLPSGRVLVSTELKEAELELPSLLPIDFDLGVVRIFRIATFDLKNLEMMGKLHYLDLVSESF
jgi:hypothetical protein